jgi:hypothetical protein
MHTHVSKFNLVCHAIMIIRDNINAGAIVQTAHVHAHRRAYVASAIYIDQSYLTSVSARFGIYIYIDIYVNTKCTIAMHITCIYVHRLQLRVCAASLSRS